EGRRKCGGINDGNNDHRPKRITREVPRRNREERGDEVEPVAPCDETSRGRTEADNREYQAHCRGYARNPCARSSSFDNLRDKCDRRKDRPNEPGKEVGLNLSLKDSSRIENISKQPKHYGNSSKYLLPVKWRKFHDYLSHSSPLLREYWSNSK